MTGYEPLNTLKPVAENIWIVDGPLIRFYGLPFSTRATVVQLQNGDLWVCSPTNLDAGLVVQLSALGPVRHLVAPNWIHYAYVTELQTQYSDALSWAPERVIVAHGRWYPSGGVDEIKRAFRFVLRR